jgi:hypothetical protein
MVEQAADVGAGAAGELPHDLVDAPDLIRRDFAA